MTHVVFTPSVDAYRHYADGTESGSTALANQSTSATIDVGSGNQVFGLRVRVQESGGGAGASTDDWQLRASINGGTAFNVTTSSSGVRGFNSTNLTDGGATTNRLTGGSGSFIAGKVSEDGLLDDHELTANNHTEYLYSLELVAADLATNDSITFSVLYNGSSITHNVTPTVSIQKIETFLRTTTFSASGSFATTARTLLPAATTSFAASGSMASAGTNWYNLEGLDSFGNLDSLAHSLDSENWIVGSGGTTLERTTAFSGAGSLATTASIKIAGTTAYAASGALATSAKFVADTAYSGAGSLATAATIKIAATTAFAATGSLASTAVFRATTAFSGAGSLSTNAAGSISATTAFAATGTLTSTARFKATTAFSGIGSLSTTAAGVLPATTAFAAAGSLSTSATLTIPATTTFTGAGTLSTTGAVAGGTISRTTGFSASASLASSAKFRATSSFAGTASINSLAKLKGVTAFSAEGIFVSAAIFRGATSYLGRGNLDTTAIGGDVIVTDDLAPLYWSPNWPAMRDVTERLGTIRKRSRGVRP
jgi:hypothetical protein